jgi:hypothetical protein
MITTTIILLAGALPLRMAAIFISTVSERAENFPSKRLDNDTITLVQWSGASSHASQGRYPRVQRKRGKESLSERANWKKVTQQSTKWEWRDDKNGGKLTWQSATNNKHENERRGKKEEGTRAWEMLEEWGNNRSKIHKSINRTTVIRSDAPQEEIKRDMICGVMLQMNRGTKTITLHSNQQQGERIPKTKIQQKWLSCITTD